MLSLVSTAAAEVSDQFSACVVGITVRHVLTHTAGLADFDTGNIGFS